jgi:septal ring factor EnvC (AmiA/AmiB activator)
MPGSDHKSTTARHKSFLALAVLLSAAVVAESPGPVSVDQQRQADLNRIRARIEVLKQRVAQSQKNVATLQEEVKQLDWKIEIGEHERELLAAQREDLTRQLAATSAQHETAAAGTQKFGQALVVRARVLHRLGRFGYFRILLEARDAAGFLQSVERLDSLARRDGRLLAAYRDAQALSERILAEQEILKRDLDQNYSRSRRELAQLADLRRRRETLLVSERNASTSQRNEVVALSDKAERLERLLATLESQSTGEPADSSGGIRPWKGVLDWPAKGPLVETFGRHRHPKFDAWTMSNGIALSLPEGTPVRAVYAGKAVYAQWLAEYGNLVILDHGDGVFTLYAWLQSVAVAPGSYVPVGGAIGSTGTGPGRDEPGLYFEVRDRQKASDPVAWLR